MKNFLHVYRFGEELVTETSDGYARHTIIPLKTREHNESSKARLERSKELIDAHRANLRLKRALNLTRFQEKVNPKQKGDKDDNINPM